jgi:Na+-translocating ferredoxin:NAD+ oxidoreductase subunit B
MKKVVIHDTCIGCMRCLDVCPVDALVGVSYGKHEVLLDLCIGCGLCIPACPVDCIQAIQVLSSTVNAAMCNALHQRRRQRLQQHALSDSTASAHDYLT